MRRSSARHLPRSGPRGGRAPAPRRGRDPIEAEGRSLTVTASFGIASRSVAGENLEHLLTFADRALYRAKDLGRNRVEVHAP
ncbi:MAG: diguanylate cyclase [Elusimicrobia bacterium]|nr:diguanylate cyclase [Elusimicrobiota bacterium]